MTLSVDEARHKFATAVECQLATELVGLNDCLGRTVAQDLSSEIQVPPTDNSAMDGFAIRAGDARTAGAELSIDQRIAAGDVGGELSSGSAARIFTGAAIPQGADAVVIQENCAYEGSGEVGGTVKVLRPVVASENIRPAGQDIGIGDKVVTAGQKLNAIDLGLIASIGVANVPVYRTLKVAVFSTGDELAVPGQPLKPGQIYNSNRTMLLALCQQLGFEPLDCGIVEDTLGATKAALRNAAQKADLVISSGGVSVGEEDHIRPAVEALGELQHWKVQMKPGKPVVLGNIEGTPFLGLPGNPVSAFVVFQLLGLPLLQTLQGQALSSLNSIPAIAGFSKKETSREEFIRVQLNRDNQQLKVTLFDNQSSGVLFSLAWADGLVRQRIGTAINEGDQVEFLPLVEGQL